MRQKLWANSGDSHFLEPQGLWQDILPAALAARMPRSVKDPDGEWETIFLDGEEMRRRIPAVARKRGSDGLTMVEASFARTTGGHDMAARLRDLDEEGIWGEVMYPSVGLWTSGLRDRVLVREAARAVNDWARTEIMARSSRFVVPAALPVLDAEDAAAEAARAASVGYRAVFLPVAPPEGIDDFNFPTWDVLWATCEEAGLVVTFHIGVDPRAGRLDVYPGPGSVITNYTETTYSGQRIVTKMVASGNLERHPELRILLSEGGGSWVPFLGDRMNEAYRQHAAFVRPELKIPPKETLFRQVYTTFQHDVSSIGAMTSMGYENIMWGSDYPHVEGTFGHTQETLHQLFDEVPAAVRDRITVGAFLELFPEVGRPPALSGR